MRLIIGVKNPTEELMGIYFSLWSWDISLTLNMTAFFYPLSALRATSPEGGSKVRFYCLYERSEVISREGEFPQSI